MKSTTVALFLSIICMIALIGNAILHVTGVMLLNDLQDPQLQQARKLLLGIALAESLLVMCLFIMIIYISRNSDTTILSYLLLFLSICTIFASGVISAIVASQLQCLKTTLEITQTWQYATGAAVSGILSTVMLLLILLFSK